MKAKDILNIKTGYTFKGTITHDPKGEVFVIQPKDINKRVDFLRLTKILLPKTKSSSSPYLEKDDLLLTARGSFKAYTFKEADKKCLTPASIYVLKVNSKEINPEYITYYLNSPKGQKQMLSKLELMTVPSLNKKNIEEIDIPVPSLDKQNEIVSLVDRKEELKDLWDKKLYKQNLVINQVINHLMQGAM